MIQTMKYVTALFCLVFTLSANAALDETKVQDWLSAVAASQQWSEANDGSLELIEDKVQGLSEVEAEAILKNEPLYKEFMGIASQYGFDSLQSLKARTFEIFAAVLDPEMQAQMKEGLTQGRAMLDSGMLDDGMKASMTEALSSLETMLAVSEKTTDADRQAVAPFKEQIIAFMDQE
ncbi:hypothetical protein DBZ36_18310 [Alginatibacterium sediminis]|uniref:Uncharacterized protein n=1 Tax=Alginatibacterium sediminis TaxID=2164068 RepID=A0A420E6R8_9ALTE|nr:hypothetical protein [Alginatibacterium sediminis]RKF13725.1 hypothetical protein DBZ36_18310 [Alginatibacterium sediminis]